MKTIMRTVLMQGSPPVGMAGSRQVALTTMLLIYVHNELFSQELALLKKLSGKRFNITLENNEDEFHKINDSLFFHDIFISNECKIFNLEKSEYTVCENEGSIGFETETISELDGVRIWKGEVKDDMIEGVMVWAHSGKEVESFSFTGALEG
ncbi:MAG: hypothetical protein M3Q58_15035 [Bacteroidota bacterium]|nr:hypothetical protein [Bacteroidota bacterium]